jgi:hypothetical protein
MAGGTEMQIACYEHGKSSFARRLREQPAEQDRSSNPHGNALRHTGLGVKQRPADKQTSVAFST